MVHAVCVVWRQFPASLFVDPVDLHDGFGFFELLLLMCGYGYVLFQGTFVRSWLWDALHRLSTQLFILCVVDCPATLVAQARG